MKHRTYVDYLCCLASPRAIARQCAIKTVDRLHLSHLGHVKYVVRDSRLSRYLYFSTCYNCAATQLLSALENQGTAFCPIAYCSRPFFNLDRDIHFAVSRIICCAMEKLMPKQVGSQNSICLLRQARPILLAHRQTYSHSFLCSLVIKLHTNLCMIRPIY